MDPHIIIKQEEATLNDDFVHMEVKIEEHPIEEELKQETYFKQEEATLNGDIVHAEVYILKDEHPIELKQEPYFQEILPTEVEHQNQVKDFRDVNVNDFEYYTKVKEEEEKSTELDPSTSQSSFLSFININKFNPSDSKNTLQCQHCDYSTVNCEHFKTHLQIHTEEKTYQCSHCAKVFPCKSSQIPHKTTHNGEKTYLCSDCAKVFPFESSLEPNKTTHKGVQPFRCSYCNISFLQKSHLEKHLIIHTIHASETFVRTQYQCRVCEEWFAYKSDVESHLKMHRVQGRTGVLNMKWKRISTPAPKLEVQGFTGPLAYQSSPSGPSEQQPKGKSPHAPNGQSTPIDRKTYQCNSCENCFTFLDDLIEHLKISHSIDNSYQCSHCKKWFALKKYLTKHQKMHTGGTTHTGGNTHTGEKNTHRGKDISMQSM